MEKRIKIRLVDKLPLMIRINMFISTSTSLWISVKNISCKSFSSSSHVLVHNKHSIHICLKANTYFPLGLQFPETGTKMSEFLILLENARIFFPPGNLRIIKGLCSWLLKWSLDAWNRACLISFLLLRALQLPIQELHKWEKNVPFIFYSMWSSSYITKEVQNEVMNWRLSIEDRNAITSWRMSWNSNILIKKGNRPNWRFNLGSLSKILLLPFCFL